MSQLLINYKHICRVGTLVKEKCSGAVCGNKEEKNTERIKIILFMFFLFAAELTCSSQYSSVKIYCDALREEKAHTSSSLCMQLVPGFNDVAEWCKSVYPFTTFNISKTHQAVKFVFQFEIKS